MDVLATRDRAKKGDRASLAAVARDIGHGLVRPERGAVARLRRALSGVRAGDSHGQTYLAALREVLAAFDSGIGKTDEVAAAEVAVTSRKWWRDLILALRAGAGEHRPSDLAAEAGRERSAVSRDLAELAALGLVEIAAAPPGQDARSRRYRLTLRGDEVAERVAAKAAAATAAAPPPGEELGEHERALVEATVAAALDVALHLVTEGSIRAGYLAGIVGRRLPQPLAAAAQGAILERVAATTLGRREADLLVSRELAARASLLDSISLWLTKPEAGALAWMPQLLAAVAAARAAHRADVELVVRCGAERDKWDLLFEQVHAPGLSGVRTVSWQDLMAAGPESTWPEASSPYLLVYEQLPLLKTDLSLDEPRIQALHAGAAERMCFVATGEELPSGFAPIAVAA
jgi:DNA-binding MarR family transcriptional regulator